MSIILAKINKNLLFWWFLREFSTYIKLFYTKNVKFHVSQMFWEWHFWISKSVKIAFVNDNKTLFFWWFLHLEFTTLNANEVFFIFQNWIKHSGWNFFETIFLLFFRYLQSADFVCFFHSPHRCKNFRKSCFRHSS